MTDQSPLAPFILDEAEAARTSHCLMLFDGDMEDVEDVFEEHNAGGNGHGWEGLAQSLVHSFMPELADRLDFGSESGTFVVTSTDLTALKRLGDVLRDAFHNRDILARQIQVGDPLFLPR
ncbi:Imm51 family immunity protein [Streptomyces sp. NBC_01589]|uniref:Imm51 family immunity protein n=1 Tax=unclassified Streptomyces TaxID=2593676 RepID=UPI00386B84EB